MRIDLIPLTATDREIPELLNMYNIPSTEIYISISDDYFDYVTGTEGIVYYKIVEDGILTGGIHCEIDGKTMYLSICVKEEYRRRGIAEAALRKLLFALPEKVNIIEVSIDETNIASQLLFQKLGFTKFSRDYELIIYRKMIHWKISIYNSNSIALFYIYNNSLPEFEIQVQGGLAFMIF